MSFSDAVRTCLRKYATFSGRAARSEFWWFILAYVLGAIAVALLGLPILSLFYALALFLPLSAAGARRLQDTGRNGYLIFVPTVLGLVTQTLAPAPVTVTPGDPEAAAQAMAAAGNWGLLAILGLIQFIVTLLYIWWLTRPGDPGPNAYGPPPAATGPAQSA